MKSRPKTHPSPDLETVASILVDAQTFTSKDVCKKWNITRMTISNYRKRLKTSPELLQLFTQKRLAVNAALEPPAMPTAIDVINQSYKWLKENIPKLHPSPENVHAVVGAAKILRQSEMADRAMTEYINALQAQQQPTATSENGRSVSGQTDSATGSSYKPN